jgi:hypothetical protein
MLKQWNVDEVARKMSSSLLSDWIAFIKLENEELDKELKQQNLILEAKRGIELMKGRRGKK